MMGSSERGRRGASSVCSLGSGKSPPAGPSASRSPWLWAGSRTHFGAKAIGSSRLSARSDALLMDRLLSTGGLGSFSGTGKFYRSQVCGYCKMQNTLSGKAVANGTGLGADKKSAQSVGRRDAGPCSGYLNTDGVDDRFQGIFWLLLAVGCKSCVRPVCAVLMTAGLDVIRRSGPYQNLALDGA